MEVPARGSRLSPIELARRLLYAVAMKKLLAFVAAPASLLVAVSLSAPAHAGIDACGDINLEANAECTMEVSGGCEVQCVPLQFTAACSAELHVGCEGECSASASVECNASCQGSCEASCEVDPGSFECSAECTGGCNADCSAACAADGNGGRCEASCRASCSVECDAGCSGTAPSASCEAQCEASCSGGCTAEANVDCQIDCQADGYIDCEARLEGGCKAACQAPEGALFCDGQYVDHGGNLEECVNALRSLLDIEVTGYASSSSNCEDGTCTAAAEAGGSASCSVGPSGPSGTTGGAGLAASLLTGLGAVAFFRRKRSPRVTRARR